jgi:hypothetical protein
MAYTNIDDPSAHFQTVLWTGDGSTSDRNITNSGNSDLKPDFIWGLCRSAVQHRHMFDSSRGYGANKELVSNYHIAEGDTSAVNTGGYGYLGPSLTDGFESSYGSVNNGYWNVNARTYCAWQWKAAGGTTASNSVGDISSTVQANTTAGFSIVTYTGNGNANQTIGHGLGTVPKMIIFINRSTAAYRYVYHVATGNDTMMYLNLTNGAQSLSSQFSTPTTTTFNVSNENSTFSGYNTSGDDYVAYVFAEIQGYSKIGSFEGNSNANGPFIYTGFQPAYVMIKPADVAEHWVVHDNQRDPFNKTYHYAFMNETEVEAAGGTHHIDLLSNGFKIRTSNNNWNASSTITYMAFAQHPFVTSTGIPTTAR